MTTHSAPANTDLRTRLKEKRRQMSPQATERGGLLMRGRLYTWLATNATRLREEGKTPPDTIAAFWPLPVEPDLRPLLYTWAQEEGYRVCLPVVTGPDQPLQFRLWSPDEPMRTGNFGIQEPTGDIVPAPAVILVPVLGYTRQGDRIGYGKGYYDRTLASLKQAGHHFTTLGLAWATGDLSDEPYTPAAHDVPLDGILTDMGWAVPAPVLTSTP